ncbi:hypothetical protein HDU84_008314 [Entophlyctis sp. JEL0112]|nr:hypothetical protein HDU84_008314 [Entophlyctis sp. JEL0112]
MSSEFKSASAVTSACVLIASIGLSYALIYNPSWCFSDYCVHLMGNYGIDGTMETLSLFYFLLIATITAAIASQSSQRAYEMFSRKIAGSINLAEALWFGAVTLITCAVIPIILYQPLMEYFEPCTGAWNSSLSQHCGEYTYAHIIFCTIAAIFAFSAAFTLGLVLLPVSKYSAIADILGLSYSATLRVHAWLGYLALFHSFMHAVALIFGAFTMPVAVWEILFSVPEEAVYGQTYFCYLTGFAAFVIMLFVVGTSMPVVRQKYFSLFFASHLLMFGGVVILYIHGSLIIYFLLPGELSTSDFENLF